MAVVAVALAVLLGWWAAPDTGEPSTGASVVVVREPTPLPVPAPRAPQVVSRSAPESGDVEEPPEPPVEATEPPEVDDPEQREAVKRELALPEPMTKLHGSWDGYLMNEARLEVLAGVMGRPLEPSELAQLRADLLEQQQESSLAVGEYRMGELAEAEAEALMEEAHAAFRSSALEITGLDEETFDSVFGLGTLR